MRTRLTLASFALLAACTAPLSMPDAVTAEGPAPDILMLGEQHDAADHQVMHSRVVKALSARGTLAAVVLEMAERGRSTAGLPAGASETEVRQALLWDERGWPWAPYRPAVMAAVAAGVPVLGGNLPRPQLREAMADAQLDAMLPGPALKAQQQAIRQGHCDMLPESQIAPMTRVQIARDRALAQTLAAGGGAGQDGAAAGRRAAMWTSNWACRCTCRRACGSGRRRCRRGRSRRTIAPSSSSR